MLAGSELEARVSPSRAAFNVRGVPVILYGSAVNPGLFDGLVEKKVHGHWYSAVFSNGHRYSEWSLARRP